VYRDDTETLAEQIDWALEYLAVTDEAGTRIEIYCHDDDAERQVALKARGLRPTDVVQVQRSRTLAPGNIGTARPVPDGFVVRSVVDPEFESPRMSRLFNRAFKRDFHQPTEYRHFARLAPSYRAEFEIVVDAPDGSLASHVGLTPHDEESFLIVEPVCTDPEFENLGLARAAMRFGLELAAQRGIRSAFIGADGANPVSNHTYESMGFADPRFERQWRLDL
jgi:GNAT superfamily N-acetyltransferase